MSVKSTLDCSESALFFLLLRSLVTSGRAVEERVSPVISHASLSVHQCERCDLTPACASVSLSEWQEPLNQAASRVSLSAQNQPEIDILSFCMTFISKKTGKHFCC